MVQYLNYLILIIIHQVFSLEKIIKTEYDEIRGQFFLGFNITVFNTSVYLNIDLQKPYTWLSLYLIDSSELESLESLGREQIQLSNDNKKEEALISTSSFIFRDNNISINDLYFYFIRKNLLKNKDSLGLSPPSNNNNFSFLYRMKEQGLINELSFGFGPHEKLSRKGYLYFGSLPNSYTKKLNKGSCKINHQNNQWGFFIQSINVKEHYYNIDKKSNFAVIVTDSPYILVPKSFMYFLYQHYFDYLFSIGYCQKTTKEIYCFANYMELLPKLSIKLDRTELILSPRQLFRAEFEFCTFLIRVNENDDKWIFGNSFIKAFTILFDYTKEEIVFYGKDNVKGTNANCLLLLYLILIFMLLLNILLLITKIKYSELPYY